MKLRDVALDDKYTLEKGQIFVSGIQALVRLPMLQSHKDQNIGLNTAGFVTGYRGSPLGGLDQQLLLAQEHLTRHRVKFTPAVNEDLGATAVWGTQQASLGGGGKQPVSVSGGPKAGRLENRSGDLVDRAPRGPDGSGGRGITIGALTDLAKHRGVLGDPVVRQAMIRLHILGEVNRWNMLRAKAGAGRTGGEGNMAKLAMSELVRQSREVGNLVNGADGMLDRSDSSSGGIVQEMTLFSPAPSIYGGTDQVQRNIIGERVLGLAKEPGPAKGTPFQDLPQN